MTPFPTRAALPAPARGGAPRRLLRSLPLLAAAAAVAACGGGDRSRESRDPTLRVARNYADSLGVDLSSMEHRPSGLYVEDVKVGDGARADSGDVVTVQYTGWLPSGKKFDSSRDRARPFEFALGYGQVISGWDQGVVGMRVGGERRLVIPPALGYGTRPAGNGVIPAMSTLIFDVELVGVQNRTPEGDGGAPATAAPADSAAGAGAGDGAGNAGGSR